MIQNGIERIKDVFRVRRVRRCFGRYDADYDGTNHYEIHDRQGKFFYWDLCEAYEAWFRNEMDSPQLKILGEMMDLWCKEKNARNGA
jgi:hypothetical protein